MRLNKIMSRLLLGLCMLLLMTLSTNTSFAQGEETPQQLLKYSVFQVKPGMDIEFEELIKSWIPAMKNMGVKDLTMLKTSNFGIGNKYIAVTPLEDLAELDAELSQPRTNVPSGLIPVMSAIQRMVVSVHEFMLIPQTDLNVPPAEDYNLKIIVSLKIGTAPGREEDFKKGMKEVATVIGKTDTKGVLIGKVGFGGNLDEYIMFGLYDSFKELAANQSAVDKAVAKLDLSFLDGVVYYRESEILVRVPELCIIPE